MKWVKFSERDPWLAPLHSPVNQTMTEMIAAHDATEIVVRSAEFMGDRRAKYHYASGQWLFCDCTHPMQNCAFSTSIAEWLED